MDRRVLRSVALLAVAALAIGLCSSAQAAPGPVFAKGYGDNGQQTQPGAPPASPVAEGSSSEGSIEVTVSTSGSTVEGRPFASSSVRRVDPVCWYRRGQTGMEYFEYWKPGGPARQSWTLEAYAAQGLLHAGYEAYATDTAGHWYEAGCAVDAPAEVIRAYVLSHPAVYVLPADPVPAEQVEVDPVVLAQIASEAMELPEGTIRWNPSLDGSGATVVNMDTWVWVEGAPTTVSVTASVPSGAWARVDATLSGLELSASGADPVSCPDTGVAWTVGAASTSCSIGFYRSSANQPVKAGQAYPTATLTAQATWAASWTSSVDPATRTALPAQQISATAEVPVAEIQSIVTSRS
jgi:hypothetical protein